MDYNSNEQKHARDYKPKAWHLYSFEELGQWVGLLMKRAGHRNDLGKAKKDIYDARNYLDMMKAKLMLAEQEIIYGEEQEDD